MAKHRVLVAYASKHGSTEAVAAELAETLRRYGFDTDLHDAGTVASVEDYDAVLVGGALYMGRWHEHARSFLKRHHAALRELPVAAFALGPQDLLPEHVAQSRGQLEHALRRTPDIRPASVAIFGGVVDPEQLRFPFSRLRPVDARDWDAVRAWGDEVAHAVEARVATPA